MPSPLPDSSTAPPGRKKDAIFSRLALNTARGLSRHRYRQPAAAITSKKASGKEWPRLIAPASLNGQIFFWQTNFTYRPGQDHRLPYDPSASFSAQVGAVDG